MDFPDRAATKAAIIARTKQAREEAGLTAKVVAINLLGDYENVEQTYSKYENRSPIPHDLIGRFCWIVRKDPAWLLTGHRWPDAVHSEPAAKQPSPKLPKIKSAG